MAWLLYRWVWLVESPLHIGVVPAGMLNRTRLYVPASALWGALTAELARLRSQGFPDYERVGTELCEKTRLGYLFPAEKIDGQWRAWLPHYEERSGLVWQREDGKTEEEQGFRRRLLITRPGTAIEPESDAAAEGTLREFELISTYWRSGGMSLQPVALVGYIFCVDTTLVQELEQIQFLWIGGDTRYGLGRLERVAWSKDEYFFGEPVDLQGVDPVVKSSCVLAHTHPCADNTPLVGAMELFGGWSGLTGKLTDRKLTWVPGSVSKNLQDFTIQEDGLWWMG